MEQPSENNKKEANEEIIKIKENNIKIQAKETAKIANQTPKLQLNSPLFSAKKSSTPRLEDFISGNYKREENLKEEIRIINGKSTKVSHFLHNTQSEKAP